MQERERSQETVLRLVDLLEEHARSVVVVGAAAASFYEFGPTVHDLRRTIDVDCVVECLSRTEYERFI